MGIKLIVSKVDVTLVFHKMYMSLVSTYNSKTDQDLDFRSNIFYQNYKKKAVHGQIHQRLLAPAYELSVSKMCPWDKEMSR